MACLIITAGPERGRYFQLTSRPMVAGRDPARDIQITDPKVSRRHFQIRKEADGYHLLEMRALNGVFVNGERVRERVLVDGDEIQIGDTVMTYFDEDEPDRTDGVKQFKKTDRLLRERNTLHD